MPTPQGLGQEILSIYTIFIFPNILFVSADAQHKKYVTGAELIKLRHYGSFVYMPSDRNSDPEEYDKAMRYIKNGILY